MHRGANYPDYWIKHHPEVHHHNMWIESDAGQENSATKGKSGMLHCKGMLEWFVV